MATSKSTIFSANLEQLKHSSIMILQRSVFLNEIRSYRSFFIVSMDSLLALLSYLIAFQIRFDFAVPTDYMNVFFNTLPLVLGARIASFLIFRIHTRSWSYVSIPDCQTIVQSVFLGSLGIAGIVLVFSSGYAIPRGIMVLDWIICVGLICGVRLAARVVWEFFSSTDQVEQELRKVIIIGAGDAGEMLMREIRRGSMNNGIKYKAVGFLDDDTSKWGIKIQGCEVLGGIDELSEICKAREPDEVLIALPAASRSDRQNVLRHCRGNGLPFKTVPSLADICLRKVKINQIQEVEPEDILEREPVSLDLNMLRKEIQGSCILVTGAAGSIGSELCRQVAKFDPREITLYDRAESNLYFLELEMKRNYPSVEINTIIGDILNEELLNEVIASHLPEFLFHAAAYKHVPLMEAYPLEAIQNNIFGSETVGRAAIKGGVKKVVFISTDKAVNPVGVMGMTKRVSECLLQTLNNGSTTFIAVRFGNVLGSDGSVLPIFKGQIDRGESLTVTDARATRYFMLISEAAKLVVQSGVMGKGGEIYFLDMGDPVRIMDMAEKLVRLSGYVPHKDVHIHLSGLRPGERLQEELVMEQESLLPTDHEKIFAVKSQPIDFEAFAADMEHLRSIVKKRDLENVLPALKTMVDRY